MKFSTYSVVNVQEVSNFGIFGNFGLRMLNLKLLKIPMQKPNKLLSTGTITFSEAVFLSIPIEKTVVIYWRGKK